MINDGKLKFEDLDRPVEVEDPSRVKVKMARKKHGTPREADLEKVVMPKKRYLLSKSEEVKQALYRPLKGQKNDHAS